MTGRLETFFLNFQPVISHVTSFSRRFTFSSVRDSRFSENDFISKKFQYFWFISHFVTELSSCEEEEVAS